MTFTEGWADREVGKEDPIKPKWTPMKNKENFVGVKKPLVKTEQLKPKIDTKLLKPNTNPEQLTPTIDTKKQKLIVETLVKNSFSGLSPDWIKKVALSYMQFDSKAIAEFFAAIDKNALKSYPKSMIATSLFQYGKNVHDGKLSVVNYKTYLQALVDDNDKLKNLYKTFSTKNDPAFADFKRFKAQNQNKPQTIEQISEGKWFTNETYVFFQYLSSKSFQTNKPNIERSFTPEERKSFNQYTRYDARMRQIVWVMPVEVTKNEWLWLDYEEQDKLKEGSFEDTKNIFMNDSTKEDWPKQIVEDVDQTVFWTEWLVGDDVQNIFLQFQKKLSKVQRESLLARYPQLIPAKMNKENFINYCMWITWQKTIDQWFNKSPDRSFGRPNDQWFNKWPNRSTGRPLDKGFEKRREGMYKRIFENIITKWLQPQTKADVQHHVMDVYFEQVAWILKAGWKIVKTEAIIYNKDGTIDMKYSTPRGIQGTIHISPTGEVTILDMFAYRSENEKWNNQNIIEKIQNKLMDGRLPSMKEMMWRCSMNKTAIFDAREWNISANNNNNMLLEKESVAGNMVTQTEEHSRKILDISMNKMLSMTQTADKLWEFIQHSYTVLWVPQNDIYTKYLRWEIWFMDSKVNTQVEWLFGLRTDLLNNQDPWYIERFNNNLDILLQTYQWNTISKENYPFGVSESEGKETLFQFISRFCLSDKQFDMVKFENCVHQMNAQKPNVPTNINDFYVDNMSLFPSQSLYLKRYPRLDVNTEIDEKNKTIEKIPPKEEVLDWTYAETRKELWDLNGEIKLVRDLDRASVA